MAVNPYSQPPYYHTSPYVPNVPLYATGADQGFLPFNPHRAALKEYAQHPDRSRARGSYLPTPPSSASCLVPSPSFSASPVASASSTPYANIPPTVNTIRLANAFYARRRGHSSVSFPPPYATHPPANPGPAPSIQYPISARPETRLSPTGLAPPFSRQHAVPAQPVAGPSSTTEVEGNSTAVPAAPLKNRRLTKVEKRKAVDASGLPIHPDEPAAKKLRTFEWEILNDTEPLPCCKAVIKNRGKLRRHLGTDKHRKAWAAAKNKDVPVLRKFTCQAMFCNASYTVKVSADRHREKCTIYKAEMEIRKAAAEAAAAANASADARLALYSQLDRDSAPFMTASAAAARPPPTRPCASLDALSQQAYAYSGFPSWLEPAVEQSEILKELLAPGDLYPVSASPTIPHPWPVPLSSWSSLAETLS